MINSQTTTQNSRTRTSSARMHLSAGVFEVTGCKSSDLHHSLIRVTVSDGGDEVSDDLLFRDKDRLSVKELAWSFRAILIRAQNGVMDFKEYCRILQPKGQVADVMRQHDHVQNLLLKLSYMDVTADMIPALIDEITEKYELEG